MSEMMTFNDNESMKFLSKEELMEICPVAMKDKPTNPGVSDKYVHANTMTVVDDLAKLGWYPVQAKQRKTRRNSSGIRSFHMIAFQNPDVKIEKRDSDGNITTEAYPRIILTNSHDGFNSFRFMVGVFRLVCSNGLVIATDKMVDMSVRHINYTFDVLRDVVKKSVEQIPDVVMTMNTMKNVILTDEQKRRLAEDVYKIRKDYDDDVKVKIDSEIIDDILAPVREEDKGDDLWSVFNVCQEKMIKGGFINKTRTNRYMKVRSITSVKKDLNYNQRLWKSAMKYMERV